MLTKRQSDVLAVLAAFAAVRGYPPTVREIMDAMAPPLRSPNGVRCHLRALARKGAIEWEENTARGIKLLTPVVMPQGGN